MTWTRTDGRTESGRSARSAASLIRIDRCAGGTTSSVSSSYSRRHQVESEDDRYDYDDDKNGENVSIREDGDKPSCSLLGWPMDTQDPTTTKISGRRACGQEESPCDIPKWACAGV
jgi:hypothetical protein